MTLSAARIIFGLSPDEDPRPHLPEIRQARDQIAEWARTATDDATADRYQAGLIEFDQALAAILEYLDEQEPQPLEPTPPQPPPVKPLMRTAATATAAAPRAVLMAGASTPPAPPATPQPARPPESVRPAPAPRRRSLGWLGWSVVMVLLAAGGGLAFYQYERDQAVQRQARVAELEREGSQCVEQRRWQDAGKCFAEIEELAPGAEVALLGRRSVEAGMAEDQAYFVANWIARANAELEADRLDAAQAAIRQVLDKYPGEKQAAAIAAHIAVANAARLREATLAAARQQRDDRQWDEALASARKVLATAPDDADAQAIIADVTAAKTKQAADLAKAKDLLAQARARDQGKFDSQALACLREAAILAPGDAEITARLEKMLSYTRTLRVPGDFATPAEALADAHDRDRIVLAEQSWKGQLVVNAAVEIQGAGSGKSIIFCPATDGCPIVIGPAAKGARITGITFRHEAFHAVGDDRFSAALVNGGSASFVDCRFSDASGHGLVVIENGSASASHCRFSDNGWNGAAACGPGTSLEITDSEAINNYGHGIEAWDGAAITISNSRCEGNCRNGIHADSAAGATTITGNQLVANREFGLVLDSGSSGKITDNTARANLLGGFVIRKAAAALPVTHNDSTLNQGPGLVLEKGLPQTPYASNTSTKNTPQQILTNADLAQYDPPKVELKPEPKEELKEAPKQTPANKTTKTPKAARP